MDRSIKQKIAFGTGTHVCTGQHAARLESSMLLSWFLENSPAYELEHDKLQRGLLAGMHGFRQMSVKACG